MALNILVATITTIRFYSAGCFSWRVFWPLAVGSIPFAFLGGYLTLPGHFYKPLVGVALLVAAYRLAVERQADDKASNRGAPLLPSLLVGAGIGLLSGLTGVGGGIYLTPILLFTGWAETKESAGISAAFILVNSVAAIFGVLAAVKTLPSNVGYWALAAVVGGIIGSHLGSRRLANITLRRLLAVVLVIAAIKFMVV